MSETPKIVRTVDVEVDPATAFEIFSDEIGQWWHSADYSWQDPARAVGMRIEPRVGGRWVEIWNHETGDGVDWGRVLVWEPGRRLALTYEVPNFQCDPPTQLDIRFEPTENGSRVTLVHAGLERLDPRARDSLGDHAWTPLITWFRDYAQRR